MVTTHMRYLVARKEARPLRKNCRAEIILNRQIWIGIHRSGPILGVINFDPPKDVPQFHKPFGYKLRRKFGDKKANSSDRLSSILRLLVSRFHP